MLPFILKTVLLIGLVKTQQNGTSAKACAFIYTISMVILSLVLTPFTTEILVQWLLILISSYVYFYLLEETDGSLLWWVIFIIGIFVVRT